MAFLQFSGDDKFVFHAQYHGGHANQKDWVVIIVDDYETVTAADYFDDWSGEPPNAGDVLTVFQVTDRRDLSTSVDAYRLSVVEWNVSYKLLGGRAVRTLAPFYNTVAEAEAESISAPAVQILDEASDGDEAAGYYYRTGNDGADVPSHDHYLTDLDGKNFAFLSRTIKVNTVGKVVHTEFKARMAELNAKGGGELKIRDTHLTTGSIDQILTTDVVFDFGSTGKITTGAGTNPHVLNLLASADFVRRIVLVNPRIDVSAGTGGGGNSGTAISFNAFLKAEVHGGLLYAGNALDSDHGDSGITSVATDLLVDGLSISGFDDNGIYVTGDSSLLETDDGWTAKVVNCSIEHCGNAINNKRQFHNVLAQGNAIRFCGQGIVSEGADTVQQPGWRYQILGNFIEKTVRYPIHMMGPTKAIIANNHIKDFGYDDDGLTFTSLPRGIWLDGVVKALVQGNRIEMLDWVPAGGASGHFHKGVYIGDNANIFGTAYVSGQSTFSGNRYRSLDVAMDDDDATHSSRFNNEHLAQVDILPAAAQLHDDTHVTYTTEEAFGVTIFGGHPNEFTNGVRSYSASLANSELASFQLPAESNTYLITIATDDTGDGCPNGQLWARKATPLLVDINLNTTTEITLTTGVLTPPTAPDLHTILSIHTTGVFYIENRTGVTRIYSILVQPVS